MRTLLCALGIALGMIACGDPDHECAGDCNGDGAVAASEVQAAVSILGGIQLLDTCQAADINGDGEVFANEITLITMAMEECP